MAHPLGKFQQASDAVDDSLESPFSGSFQQNYQRNWEYRGPDENLSLAKIFDFVPAQSRVLDIGCGYADLGHELKSKKSCIVWGIEQDSARAAVAKTRLDVLLEGDITNENFLQSLRPQTFDVIILADVLEHLIHGEEVLRSLQQFLAPAGCLILSVPNIAHAAVRLALFQGRFPYSEEGLLDKTHLTFYTRTSLSETVENSGFIVVDEQSTYLGALDTEIPIQISGIITESLVQTAEREPDGTTYQFILKLLAETDNERRRLIQQKFVSQASRISHLSDEVQQNAHTIREQVAVLQRTEDRFQRSLDDIHSILSQFNSIDDKIDVLAQHVKDIESEIKETTIHLQAIESRVERFLNTPPISWLRKIRQKLRGKA